MKKQLPKSLKPGDTIGIITPAGIISKFQLQTIVDTIHGLAYKSYFLPSVLSAQGYLAGTDAERAEELMHMFENKKVNAVMCARGGYGANRILNLLDYKTIQKNPKIFIGYSDISSLITAFYQKCGLVSFHGPVGISEFNEFTAKIFSDILTCPNDTYEYPYEREPETEHNSEFDFYTISKGCAEGKLIGGNLSLINSLIGTDFEPIFKNKLVFLEDIDEKPYKIDRMLTQLIQATDIKLAAGIIFGVFKGCEVENTPSFTLKETLEQLIKPLNLPSVYGFPFGHIKNNMTLPAGTSALLDANRKTLKLTEPSVY
jgi:muramoyltetrapeptide carboxypeptidase